MKRNHGLDLLRFFAISGVVLLHSTDSSPGLPASLRAWFSSGWLGVDLFFVLSGFLIAGQVFRTPDGPSLRSLTTFWQRRWWRTLPLYFFALFVYGVLKPLLGFPFNQWSWKFLLFLQNFGVIHDFAQSWSLCIEEHFYLVFPIVAFTFGMKRRTPWFWLAFAAVSVAYRFWVWQFAPYPDHPMGSDFRVRFVTFGHLDSISVGVFLAATADRWKPLPRWVKRSGGITGLVVVTALPQLVPYTMPGSSVVWLFSAIAVAFGLILISVHDLTLPAWIRLPTHKIALWSYSMYIWNGLLVRLFDRVDLPVPALLNCALFYAASVATAAPTYYLIERPFLHVRNRLLKVDKARESKEVGNGPPRSDASPE